MSKHKQTLGTNERSPARRLSNHIKDKRLTMSLSNRTIMAIKISYSTGLP